MRMSSLLAPASVREATVTELEYCQSDVPDPTRPGDGETCDPVAVYLALPPTVFGGVLRGLAALKLPTDSRIVVEKPFGHDLASARELNDLIPADVPRAFGVFASTTS
jgi:glucose-6-phosphate 1-dehydrogenase